MKNLNIAECVMVAGGCDPFCGDSSVAEELTAELHAVEGEVEVAEESVAVTVESVD